MITIETAKAQVLAKARTMEAIREAEIKEADILETDIAWYIPFHDRQPDGRKWAGVYWGFIVGKADGSMFQPGSGLSIEKWLIGFELGLLQGPYDLEIVSVKYHAIAVRQLLSLGLTYFRPEEACGEVWKIPQRFTKDMIEERLQHLPGTFKNQGFVRNIGVFVEILQKGAFTYRLHPTSEQRHHVIGEELP